MGSLNTLLPSFRESPVQFILDIALILIAVRLVILYFTTLRYPPNLPRVFEKPGATSFSWSTRWKYYVDAQSLQREAYEYTKRGKTVLMPGLGFRDEVLLPQSALKWLISQPESIVSMYEAFAEMDQIESNFPHHRYVTDPWHGNLVRKDMNASLDIIFQGLQDELHYSFDAQFGKSQEWRDIIVVDAVQTLIAQAASRFTVGLPLCRSKEYLEPSIDFVNNFIMNAGIAGAFPIILRPIVKPIAYIRQRNLLRRVEKLFAPLYAERLAWLSKPKSAEEPNDHLQLMMRYAQEHRPEELNLQSMNCRLAVANIGSFHQTYMATSNLIFNIVESDPKYDTIAKLREEFTTVLAAHGGKWTKAAIAQMWKADSVCKETLRFQGFGGRALVRKVVAKEGVVTEDGIRIPAGAMVSLPSWAKQTDPETFENPLDFNPWRYSSVREATSHSTASSTSVSKQNSDDGKAAIPPGLEGPQTFVTTGVNFLPFGHGKHACPGRFLVDGELKMLLAYFLLNYDVKFPEEYKGVRPESKWISEACFPPLKGKVLIRRRQDTV